MESIQDKINELKLTEQVIFLGARNDVADLYNVMDVFVLPSLYEGLPVVGVEAQANGLPFLCSSNVTKEVILSKTIKLLELDNDLERWTEEILKISENSRYRTKKEIENVGFNIEVENRMLCELYLDVNVR